MITRQQVVEVVGHAAGEVPQGLHLLGLEQLLAGPFQFAFGFDPVGDVTGYLGEADQPAIAVADRIDHHVGPEATAVPRTRQPSFSKRPSRSAAARPRAGSPASRSSGV